MVQAYAPKNDVMDEEKDEFYNQLQDTVSECNRNNIMVVMGKFGVCVMNGSRQRLCDLCSANG